MGRLITYLDGDSSLAYYTAPQPLLQQLYFDRRLLDLLATRLCLLNGASASETACLLGRSKRKFEERWWNLRQAALARGISLDDPEDASVPGIKLDPEAAHELLYMLYVADIGCDVDRKTWCRVLDVVVTNLDMRLRKEIQALHHQLQSLQRWLKPPASGAGASQPDPKAVEDLLQQLNRMAGPDDTAAARRTGKPPEG